MGSTRRSDGDDVSLRGARCPAAPALVLLATAAASALAADLRLELERPPAVVRPLRAVTVTAPGPGAVSVLDGPGREYVRVKASGRVTFTVGGAAGDQVVRLLDEAGKAVETAGFRLLPRTEVKDAGGRAGELPRIARATLERPNDSGTPTGIGPIPIGICFRSPDGDATVGGLAGIAREERAMFPRVRDVVRHSRQPFQRVHRFEIPSESRIVLERLVDDRLLAIEVDEPLE